MFSILRVVWNWVYALSMIVFWAFVPVAAVEGYLYLGTLKYGMWICAGVIIYIIGYFSSTNKAT